LECIQKLILVRWYWNLNKCNVVDVYVYNSRAFSFLISHRSDFNRMFSICWYWTDHLFQRLEIGSVDKIDHWNRMSRSVFNLDFRFKWPISATNPISNLIIGLWNQPGVYTQKCLLLHHSIIFTNLGGCAETKSQKYKFIIKFKQT